MLCIKLIYGLLFKITYKEKEEMTPFIERTLSKEETELQNKKKEKFIQKYKNKSLIYISIIIVFIILFGYISICYVGTFPYTKKGIIIRFFISFILSILILAILCLIVATIYHFGKKYNNKFLICCYKYIKIIF